MGIKSSVAIDANLRKKLKKLAALSDLSQGEIIEIAIKDYEKKLLTQTELKIETKSTFQKINTSTQKPEDIVQLQLQNATDIIWKRNPEKKLRQLKLYAGPDTIDDYIIKNWDTGLE